jgi:hypothetical protein
MKNVMIDRIKSLSEIKIHHTDKHVLLEGQCKTVTINNHIRDISSARFLFKKTAA